MNTFCERVIGTLRRECTDHLIALNAAHLERLLREYVAYDNSSRCHQALDGNSPIPRAGEPEPAAEVRATPVLGGLHHSYERAARFKGLGPRVTERVRPTSAFTIPETHGSARVLLRRTLHAGFRSLPCTDRLDWARRWCFRTDRQW